MLYGNTVKILQLNLEEEKSYQLKQGILFEFHSHYF